MGALLYQRISTDDLEKIMNAYLVFADEENYCNGSKPCPDVSCCAEHCREAFLEAFSNGEINFE